MSDQNQQPDPKSTPGDGGNAETTAVSNSELEQLRTDAGRIKALDDAAKVADLTNAEDLFDELEYTARQVLQNGDPAPTGVTPPATPPPDPDPKKAPDPATSPPVGALSESDRAELRAANDRSAQAALGVHAMQWQTEQATLPEGERSVATEADLNKVIMRKTAAIKEVAADYGGNVYKAADAIFNISKEGKKRVIDRAAAEAKASEKAKQDAEAGITLPTGGPTGIPANKTAQQVFLENQKKAADEIAPDDVRQFQV